MAVMSGSKSIASEINVTPMIDLLLVLLIILMVIVPSIPRGESASAPQLSKADEKRQDAVVLGVSKDGDNKVNFHINQQAVARGDLQARLSAIYANRAQHVLFLKGDDTLNFTQMAEVIDIGHAAGIDQIGLMTPGVVTGR